MITNIPEFFIDSVSDTNEKSTNRSTTLKSVTQVNNSSDIKLDSVAIADAVSGIGSRYTSRKISSGNYIVEYAGTTTEMTPDEYNEFCKSHGGHTDEEDNATFNKYRSLATANANISSPTVATKYESYDYGSITNNDFEERRNQYKKTKYTVEASKVLKNYQVWSNKDYGSNHKYDSGDYGTGPVKRPGSDFGSTIQYTLKEFYTIHGKDYGSFPLRELYALNYALDYGSNQNGGYDFGSYNPTLYDLTLVSRKLGIELADITSETLEDIVDELSREAKRKLYETYLNKSKIAVVSDSSTSRNISALDEMKSLAQSSISAAVTNIDEGVRSLSGGDSDNSKEVTSNEVVTDSYNVTLKDNLIRQWDSSLKDWENVGDAIKDRYKEMGVSVVNTIVDTLNTSGKLGKTLIKDIIDVTIGSSVITPGQIITDSTNSVMRSSGEIVNEVIKHSDGLVNAVIQSRDKFAEFLVQKYVGDAKEWTKDKLDKYVNKPIDKLSNKIKDFTGGLIDKLSGLDSKSNLSIELYKPQSNQTMSSLIRNQWNYLRNIRKNINDTSTPFYRFATTYDWLIKITPHNTNDNYPPNLNNILGLSNNDYLPILNYSLTEAGLENTSYNFLTTNLIIPYAYRRPSRLTITLPDMYVATGDHLDPKSYIRTFKEEYINWVKKPNTNDKLYSLVNRDYRECCYEITIYKFPYVTDNLRRSGYRYSESDFGSKMDFGSGFNTTVNYNYSKLEPFVKTYLALPDISITDSGSDSKQLVTESLSFNIVGEITK